MNKNLGTSILEILSKDDSARIRQSVASHSNSTPEMLELLSTDMDESVQNAVAANPKAPLSVINEFSGFKK